jgi:hypothetical protein
VEEGLVAGGVADGLSDGVGEVATCDVGTVVAESLVGLFADPHAVRTDAKPTRIAAQTTRSAASR